MPILISGFVAIALGVFLVRSAYVRWRNESYHVSNVQLLVGAVLIGIGFILVVLATAILPLR